MTTKKLVVIKPVMTSVSATALLAGAGLLAMPFTAQAGAIANLCGQTITTHVTIENVNDSLASSCYIDIANNASLTLKSSTFDLSSLSEFDIDAFGSGRFQMQGSSITSDAFIDISAEWGKVEILSLSLLSGETDVKINSPAGEVSIQDSDLSASQSDDLVVSGANVSVKGSMLSANNRLTVEAAGNLTFNDNYADVDGCDVALRLRAYGNVVVMGNDLFAYDNCSEADLLVESWGPGQVTFKDNTGAVEANEEADISVSSTTGNISVQNNDIALSANSDGVRISSVTGNLTVKGNKFPGADVLYADTAGKCTATENNPAFTCI